jgi:hypothetical protein
MIYIALLILIQAVTADKCNLHATLVETDTFYLTQPFTKNIVVDISKYAQAFPKMASLLPKFKEILNNYENETFIKESEPEQLIPFTPEMNIFISKEPKPNRESFQTCAQNGGSLVRLDSKNREQVVSIMKAHNIATTPIQALPFHSLLSLSEFDSLHHPTLENLANVWQKSPPWITSNDNIEYPSTIVTVDGQPFNSTSGDFKSPVLCAKPNNPWDLEQNRNDWKRMIPKINTAVSMLTRIKNSFEISSRSLKNVPTITKQIAEVFKLTLPDSFKQILSFLESFSKKRQWEQTTKTDLFANFVKSAIKLTRQFEQKPKSMTKIPSNDPKFSPPSIDELNWRESFNLDESVYGIVGPVTIQPKHAYTEEGMSSDPVHFEATITARVYNRQTDLLSIYEVKPNTILEEQTTINSIIATPHLKVALKEHVRPHNCINHETEQFKICHRLDLQQITYSTMTNLIKCANALFSPRSSPDFGSCPRIRAKPITSVYRAECEPHGKPTVIINSDSPVLIEFKCDNVKMPHKNITSFPTFIATPCEVHIVDGVSTQLALPQWNLDFVQDQKVEEEINMAIPPAEMTKLQFALICITISIVACIVLACFSILMYYCYNHCVRSHPENLNESQPPQAPDVNVIDVPPILLNEFPFSE